MKGALARLTTRKIGVSWVSHPLEDETLCYHHFKATPGPQRPKLVTSGVICLEDEGSDQDYPSQ